MYLCLKGLEKTQILVKRSRNWELSVKLSYLSETKCEIKKHKGFLRRGYNRTKQKPKTLQSTVRSVERYIQ